jgi:hypothetical protein
MSGKLRIASELHAAPGWVPLVLDVANRAAHQTDVVIWIAPRPNSFEIAMKVAETVRLTHMDAEGQ